MKHRAQLNVSERWFFSVKNFAKRRVFLLLLSPVIIGGFDVGTTFSSSLQASDKGVAYLVDSDGDGLTDDEEIAGIEIFVEQWVEDSAGEYDESTESVGFWKQVSKTVKTDPFEPDTDGDLLPDGWEVFNEGFDPTFSDDGKADIDQDGLSAGEEYLVGTDWFNPDTDGDGYLDGSEVLVLGSNPRLASDPVMASGTALVGSGGISATQMSAGGEEGGVTRSGADSPGGESAPSSFSGEPTGAGLSGLSSALSATTYFNEDFEQLDISQNGAATPSGSSVGLTWVRADGGIVELLSDNGTRHLGYNNNEMLHLESTGEGESPNIFIQSQESGVSEKGRLQLEFYVETPTLISANPMFKFYAGNDVSGNKSLAGSENIFWVDYLENGKMRVRASKEDGSAGDALFVGDDTYAFDQSHVVWVDFTPGDKSTNTFRMYVDGKLFQSAGKTDFKLKSTVTNVNAMHFIANGTIGAAIYIDNVIMHDFVGDSEDANADIYFVDKGNVNAQDSTVSGQGKSIDQPWKTAKYAIENAKPGDTLYFLPGTYQVSKDENSFQSFQSGGTALKPIRITGWKGEGDPFGSIPVITSMYQPPASKWHQEPGDPGVFYYDAPSGNPLYRNVSRNVSGSQIPMRLMKEDDQINSVEGDPAELNASWQWTRKRVGSEKRVWVQVPVGSNPADHKVQISSAIGTLEVLMGRDYVSVEDMVIEGGYYAVKTQGDHFKLKRSKLQNVFADGFKGNGDDPDYGLITDSLIKNFGESGIDITGGDYWDITQNTILDDVDNRLAKAEGGTGPKNNGIMIKNDAIGVRLENNLIMNLDTARHGAITVGGSSSGNPTWEARDLVVKGNSIRNITAPYAFVVRNAKRSLVSNNTVRDSTFGGVFASDGDSIVQFQNVNGGSSSDQNVFFDNNFDSNNSSTFVYEERHLNSMKYTEFNLDQVPLSGLYKVNNDNKTYSEFGSFAASNPSYYLTVIH